MRNIDESIKYVEKLIRGVRRVIDKEHEKIREEPGMEECLMGTWADASFLCSVVEREILPKFKITQKQNNQFSIPDGEYVFDSFFITDKDNKILIELQWTGDKWVHEYEIFSIQMPGKQ